MVLYGTLSDEDVSYETVEKAFLKQYGAPNRREDLISVAENACLNRENLAKSLPGMPLIYENENVDDATYYGILRRTVQQIPELSRFALYRGVSSYRELEKVVKDFDEGPSNL